MSEHYKSSFCQSCVQVPRKVLKKHTIVVTQTSSRLNVDNDVASAAAAIDNTPSL